MKKALAFVLALLIAIPTALAADVSALFPPVRPAIAFPDATEDWYLNEVILCYEANLLNGTGSGFSPNNVVKVSEAAALAARIHAVLQGTVIPDPVQGEPWYASYIRHMQSLGITGLDNADATISRQGFFTLLAMVLTYDHLTPINSITALPDTGDAVILAFYNAGILTGTDVYGTFSGNKTLTRAEMAVMTARVIRPTLRKTFTPQAQPQVQPQPTPGTGSTGSASDVLLSIYGQDITRTEFVTALEGVFARLGSDFDWNGDYSASGVSDIGQYLLNVAVRDVLYDTLAVQISAQNGLISDNSAEEAYDALWSLFASDVLRAKHILFRTVDDNGQPLSAEVRAGALVKAEILLENLRYTPTEENFTALMHSQSEDGRDDAGQLYAPNGYVFGANEMVQEFEEAVRALQIGGISGIVESTFGYHIILRLDPQGDPTGYQAYLGGDGIVTQIDALLDDLLSQAESSGQLYLSDALIGFDCRAQYQSWLARQ